MSYSPTHKKQKKKNYTLLAVLSALALTFFIMAMVKIIIMKEEIDSRRQEAQRESEIGVIRKAPQPAIENDQAIQ